MALNPGFVYKGAIKETRRIVGCQGMKAFDKTYDLKMCTNAPTERVPCKGVPTVVFHLCKVCAADYRAAI